MTAPLISCVIPAFNSERYLAEAVNSVLKQSYRPIEIIVADDGSSDNTAKIAASYRDDVRYVWQATAGPAATRNLGLHATKGSFVAFLDADDLWHLEKLAQQFARFEAKPGLDYCLTYAQMYWTADVVEEGERFKDHPRANALPGYATTTLLARRSTFDVVGDFNTKLWFGDATDWFIRALDQGLAMEILPDVLTYHRMHTNNLTRRHSEESKAEFLSIVKASLDRRRTSQLIR